METSKEIALVLTGTLPVISDNFEACKAYYESELKRYDTLVTAESLPDDKKNQTKLRAEIKRLDRIRIDEATRLKAPISVMESRVKELTGLIEKTVEKISSQVKKFEDETRKLCKTLMESYLENHYGALEVREEFRTGRGMVDSLVGISKVTSAGKLTKEGRENVEGLAQQGRIAQDKVDGRVATIGAECLKAGLEKALPSEYFEKYLQESDAVWVPNLARIIKIEVDRRAKEKADQEAREKKKIADALAQQQAEADRIAREKAEAEQKEKARLEKIEREKKEAERKAKLEGEKKPVEPPPVSPPPVIPPVAPKAQPTKPVSKIPVKIPLSVTIHFEIIGLPENCKQIAEAVEKKVIESKIALASELRGITVVGKDVQ